MHYVSLGKLMQYKTYLRAKPGIKQDTMIQYY